MRLRWIPLLALVVVGSLSAPAVAVPPPGVAMSTLGVSRPSWIRHRVIPGDRVVEIASRYGVTPEQVIEWNDLDPKHTLLRVGQKLRILTTVPAVEHHYRRYKVHKGDTWNKIATRFDVDKAKLRKSWNPDVEELKAGDHIVLWVEVSSPSRPAQAADRDSDGDTDSADADSDPRGGTKATAEQPARAAAPDTRSLVATVTRGSRAKDAPAPTPAPDPDKVLPIVEVPRTALSVGSPGHGHLLHGIQLPQNTSLYKIRNPDNTWGSSHAIEVLQRAIARFRGEGVFNRELVIEDMSRHYGGRFNPHHSHRSGRDVDIELPLRPGVEAGIVPRDPSLVDWTATWYLIKDLIATGQVRYIFLSRSRQMNLYHAARRAGATAEELTQYIQYPGHERTTYVRHAPGHIKHMHVRFTCAPYETQCRD